ncbi:hypothetical protein OIU79_005116 [Salix purpurea]|uniref:Uncharacterized protein n=1 Tax=Salix purpurea TaxID=77065 RepID=A0A9Q0UBU0_SALPP|nr:hypothetical protein OIU79_005116 [Salix purpurea]
MSLLDGSQRSCNLVEPSLSGKERSAEPGVCYTIQNQGTRRVLSYLIEPIKPSSAVAY